MARGKKIPNIINIDELEIENKIEIDYDKLALAIVKAKRIEEENEEKENAKALASWKKEIGYNEHTDKKGIAKKVYCFCNRIKMVLNIMFISKKKHIATSPTSAFIQELTRSFFVLIQWVLTLIVVCLVGVLFYHPGIKYGFSEYSMCIVFVFLSFILSRLFRLMAIEIEQMSNREQILGVFTAVISVIPLVEKIAELFKGVG